MRFTDRLIASAALVLAACNAPPALLADDKPASAAATSAPATVMIPVEGMSCVACAARLKRGLRSVDGVVDVTVTLQPGSARIRYLPGATDPAHLVAAINALDLTAGTPSADTSGQ